MGKFNKIIFQVALFISVYLNCLTALVEKEGYQEDQLTELAVDKTVHSWIEKESFPLAVQYAYLNGRVTGTKDTPTIVDKDYIADAKRVAERRVVLSGIRLAQELIMVYE